MDFDDSLNHNRRTRKEDFMAKLCKNSMFKFRHKVKKVVRAHVEFRVKQQEICTECKQLNEVISWEDILLSIKKVAVSSRCTGCSRIKVHFEISVVMLKLDLMPTTGFPGCLRFSPYTNSTELAANSSRSAVRRTRTEQEIELATEKACLGRFGIRTPGYARSCTERNVFYRHTIRIYGVGPFSKIQS